MNETISDISDIATNLEILASEKKIKEIQQQANNPIPKSEYCYWCNEKTKDGRRFCNLECATSWEKWGRQ